MKKKIISGFVLLAIAFGTPASFALAESHNGQGDTSAIEALRVQVAALLIQIQTLQDKINVLRGEQQGLRKEVKSIVQLTKSLREGVRNSDVTTLQEVLATDPDIYPEGLVTGYFGPLTRAAVKKFQKKFGIDQVGVVGPITKRRINELLTQGAGKSGKVPPGLLRAPGIAKKLGTSPPDDDDEDTTAPTIDLLSPTDDATDVEVDANLAITFSETVETGSGNLTVQKASDGSVVETMSAASATGSGTDTITFDLTADLAFDTAFYVMMGAGMFLDTASNAFDGITDTTTWSFTTVSETVDGISSTAIWSIALGL